MSDTKVSILCSTFNHSEYIKQALDSFLMQKTDFEFEILINDDASTDGTSEILKEYVKNYPRIVKLNIQKKNLYSQGIRNMIIRFLLPKAKGQYIAFCEGDDYWTDPHKLQKQVNFMDNNDDYSLCFHPVKVIFENGEEEDSVFPEQNDPSKFTIEEMLKRNFIQTNSVMYRKRPYRNIPTNIMPGDWYLHLYHAQFGKIGFINEVMAVYRRHPAGIWWNSRFDRKKFWKDQGMAHMRMYLEVLKLYGDNQKYKKAINNNIFHLINDFIEISQNNHNKDTLLHTLMKEYPDNVIDFLVFNASEMAEKQAYIVNRQEVLSMQKTEIILKENHIRSLEKELARIKNTRIYKALKKLKSIKKRIKLIK